MSSSLLNECVQWAVLVFLIGCVVKLNDRR